MSFGDELIKMASEDTVALLDDIKEYMITTVRKTGSTTIHIDNLEQALNTTLPYKQWVRIADALDMQIDIIYLSNSGLTRVIYPKKAKVVIK